MTIPFSILIGQRGANGVPDMSRSDNLRDRIDEYEHSIADRVGFEAMRVSWRGTRDELLDWGRAEQLGRPCEVYAPDSAQIWEGLLYEIEITIGRTSLVLSLKDMANRLVVRYSEPDGNQDATATFSNAASIATYGTKDRLLSLSTTLAAGAARRAETALNQIAFPKSKQPSESGTDSKRDMSIELRFVGWGVALGWLLTSSTSTTQTSITAQALALLASYNATNNFFSTSSTNVQSVASTDTEWIDPQTTYAEKIDKLLAQGDANQDRLFWGFFEQRSLTIKTFAGATPDVITYYQNTRSGEIRDVYGNIVAPWLVRPDAMVQVADIYDLEPAAGAIDSMTRMYASRATLRISSSGISVRLEPDNVENLEGLLSAPAGTGASGTSERQAAIERLTTTAARSRFPAGDNPSRYAGGVWEPQSGGTGIANTGRLTVPSNGTIDTGGGSISTGGGSISTGGGSISTGGGSINTGGGTISNTGGSPIDLGTGSGIGGVGSSGVSTSGGTVGAIAKWATSSSLTNAVAGTDYAAASHNHAASDITSGTMATARLGSGTASSTTFLRGDQTWQAITTITPSTIGAAPDDAKYIVQTASSGLSAEQALGALATGLLKNTTTTGVLSIATASDLPDHASRHANGGADEVALDASQITSGTMATARLGSGVASASTLLWGDSSWAALVAGDLPSHTHAASDITSGTMATARLGSGTASASTLLWGDSTWAALVAGDLPSHTHAASDITSGTMATARLGSGTASSSTYLRGDSTWATISAITGTGASGRVAIWSGTGTLTNDTGISYDTTSNDLSVAGGIDLGGATALGTGSLAASGNFRFNGSGTIDDGLNMGTATGAPAGCIRASGTMSTNGGVTFNWLGYAAGTFAQTGYVTIEVAGVSRRFMIG